MSNSKNTLFTIGQFAALHEINKKTLMWYDEVGLFKPAVVKENGYRYYTYYQSSTLETILMLRELNVSIKEIQGFMENRSASGLKNLLSEKLTALDQNIAHLKKIRKALTVHSDELSSLLCLDISQINVVQREAQQLVFVETPKDITLEKEISMVIEEIKKQQLYRLYSASYGSIIAVSSLQRGEFDDYLGVFIRNPGLKACRNRHIKPGGNYLQGFCQGTWDKIPQKYAEMLAYAKACHLKLCGHAYETGINETTINSMDEYITQIEIQIAER